MILEQRKENILDFIIRDYIKTATPVSSGRISSRGALDASPATIRWVMQALDEEGYLYQPHISAGRAPTDKGYRYFVENLMSVREPASELRGELDRITEKMNLELNSAFGELSRVLAGHLKLFSGIGILDEERIFGHGLPEVLKEPEFLRRGMAARFADFAENIHRDIKTFSDTEVDVKGFGIVSVLFRDENLGECVIFSAGPQRMNYERAASAVRYAAEDIKKSRKTKNAKRKR
ncbi:MAG: hypothetical protein HYW15_02225 [Candidatus Giovannonibacteria bacterium]|nr:MAG: hypothetical protein HYW15_02225 [Candidatus Giovannonibacteria bacterium]